MRAALLLVVTSCPAPPPPPAVTVAAIDYPQLCAVIASDIERLRPQFAQLVEFRATTAARDCAIDYSFATHREVGGGGWSAGVPHPDRDGVWFYIGIWDPADRETRQLNTQADTRADWIGSRRVTFLILEGEATRPLAAELAAILTRRGMVHRPR